MNIEVRVLEKKIKEANEDLEHFSKVQTQISHRINSIVLGAIEANSNS